MAEYDIIITKIQRVNKEFVANRTQRILEAMAFEGGSFDNRKKHLISSLPNEKESYFFKPGKEAKRKKPNIHNMNPNVGKNEISETDSWAFDKIWEYLIKISIINQITFRKVLILLYRNCFMLDHIDTEDGKLRYSPSVDLLNYIDKIEFSLKDGFKDKFKTEEIGLLEYLHFVDLIGWNEDVKYHIIDSEPNWKKYDKKVGRVNTMLTIICAPLMISNFIQDIIQKTQNHEVINVKLITSTIYNFTISRGICVMSNEQLLTELNPYLENRDAN